MGLPIGTVAVATAGTAVQIVASGNAVHAVSFKARPTNAGPIYVGGDAVGSGSGYRLDPGDELSLAFRETVDLRRFYVDADNNNDSVDYVGVSA